MITGAHIIIYSKNPEADRRFLKEVCKFSYVDAGEGWLIFKLPVAELAVHPAENTLHELYFIVDDINAFKTSMSQNKVKCSTIKNQGWGLLVYITLPGGGKLGVYEARHPQP